MRDFIIDIYKDYLDKDGLFTVSSEQIMIKSYKTNIGLDAIVIDIQNILGEGKQIKSFTNGISAYIKINIFGDKNLNELLNYLIKFQEIESDDNVFRSLGNNNFIHFLKFELGENLLTDDELNIILIILKENSINYKLIKKQDIFDRGASAFLETYFIALSAGLSVKIISKIYDYLKGKNIDFNRNELVITKINKNISKLLINEYNIKPYSFFLTDTSFKKKNIIQLTYVSNSKEYLVETNKKGELLKFTAIDYNSY